MTAEGRTYKGVGLRYSGNASYMASAGGLKRSFLVDLERSDNPDFHGLHAIGLQSGALDPAKAREALAFALFREAGVPAPRTALAEVTLTVPGRHDKAYLGLYTLVEPVDRAFLKDRFHTDKGLLLRPQGLRGLDFLGDDWEKYRGPYRPLAEPSPDEAKRLIEFVRLVQQGDDQTFRKEIASYLDVDKFLRFMAVQAMIANADGFFTLGYNYSLFLDPKTNRFVFIPGDQELSFANFAMMGSADQLMDMSLARPYGGENRLADRLLAIKEVREAHQKVLKELATTVFRKDRLLADVAAIEGATKAIVEREAAARAERAEPPVGFGPPGAPTAPDLRTFAEKRTASIADQIAGKKDGYRPQFNFGPPGGNRPLKPIDDKTIGEVVKAPPGFKVSLFAAPPKVGYPVTLSVAPDGAVYVAVDEQGSLGRTPGGGRVVRCVDDDGDGKADRVNVFAKMEHPRGVIAQDGKVWVLHPPFLSVFLDEDGDGTSDRQDVLVSGLTTSQIDERGGDHTTNGIRMGLDGWIYIAVGDYGFHGAKGKDGTTLSQRGGGILRVRPDGTELEVFAIGLRNPFAIAIDPYLNLFTRDNTNDGAGWDVRVSHLIQTADYGYSQRFANFPDEIMPPLGAFGQGGGTGALSLHDERWPEAYRGVLLTGDWGRSEVYRHDLKPAGATFRADQSVFLSIPRPTGMDLGGDGRLYVASWRGGEASVYVGPQVGFLACVAPPGWTATGRPDPRAAGLPELIDGLCGPNAASRFDFQREILRRGRARGDDPRPHRPGIRSLQALARASRGPLRTQAARRHRGARRLAEAPRRRRRPRVRTPGAGRPQDGARRRRDGPVPRSPGRPLAPGPGAGRDRARATRGCSGGGEPRPPDLAPRRLADADDEARECPARPGPGPAPPGHAGVGLAPGGGRLPGRDRRPPSRGGPPRLAVPARAEGRRGAHQEAGHDPFPRGASRHPGHAGASLSPRGGLSRKLVGNPARHDRPVLRSAGVGGQRADRLGPQGGRARRRRRDRDVPPRRARPAARPPQGAAGRLGGGPAQGRGGDPRAHRQGRPEEPGPDRQHVLRGRREAGTPGEGGCGARQEPSSPPSRAAPATPTPTARRPRGRTWWTSASATAPPSSWSRS